MKPKLNSRSSKRPTTGEGSVHASVKSKASSKRKLKLRKQAQQKRLDELKKYQVEPLSTGLELVLNEYCVCQAWKDKNPKSFLLSFLKRSFELLSIASNFESQEILVIAEFHQINLFFCKQQLLLNDYQTAVLLNIFWELLKRNNPSYQAAQYKLQKQQTNQKVPQESERDIKIR
jgi:hypothetical protein